MFGVDLWAILLGIIAVLGSWLGLERSGRKRAEKDRDIARRQVRVGQIVRESDEEIDAEYDAKRENGSSREYRVRNPRDF